MILDGYTRRRKVRRVLTHNRIFPSGVVLALNARILHRNLSIFDDLLQKYPSVEILAWTGAGEEDIPKHIVDGISQHFCAVGIEDQVSFDVSIAKVSG